MPTRRDTLRLIPSGVFLAGIAGTLTATANQTASAGDSPATISSNVLVLSGHTDEVKSAAFSPDGTRIVTASWDNTARIWDAATGSVIATLNVGAALFAAAFSPDGKRIVTASGDKTQRASGTSLPRRKSRC